MHATTTARGARYVSGFKTELGWDVRKWVGE